MKSPIFSTPLLAALLLSPAPLWAEVPPPPSPAPTASVASDDYGKLAGEWEKLARSGRWKEANALYEPLWNAAPSGYRATIDENRLLALDNLREISSEKARISANLDEASEADLRLLVLIYLHDRDRPGARTALDVLLRRFPDSLATQLLALHHFSQANDLEGEIAAFHSLITINPSRAAGYWTSIAQNQRELGRPIEAKQAAEKSIEADPKRWCNYQLLAEIASDPDETLKILREGAAAVPFQKGENLRREFIQSACKFKRYDDALAFLKALLTDDKQPLPLRERGDLIEKLAREGHPELTLEAINDWLRALPRAEPWMLPLDLASLARVTGYEVIAPALGPLLKDLPKDRATLKQLLEFGSYLGHSQNTLTVAEKLAEIDPKERPHLANRYLEQGKPDDAIRLVLDHRQEIEKNPDPWFSVILKLASMPNLAPLMESLDQTLSQKDTAIAQLARAELTLARTKSIDEATLWKIYDIPLAEPKKRRAPQLDPTGGLRNRSDHHSAMIYHRYHELQRIPSTQYRQRQVNIDWSPELMPSSIRERALIYLGAKALEEQRVPAFLSQLKQRLKKSGPRERLATYAILMADDLLREEIATALADPIAAHRPLDLDETILHLGLNSRTPYHFDQPFRLSPLLTLDQAKMLHERLAWPDEAISLSALTAFHALLEQSGHPQEAQALLQEWLDKPLPKTRLKEAIHVALALKQPERATESFQKLPLEEQKQMARVLDAAITLFAEQGKEAAALDLCEQLYQIQLDNPRLQLAMSSSSLSFGRTPIMFPHRSTDTHTRMLLALGKTSLKERFIERLTHLKVAPVLALVHQRSIADLLVQTGQNEKARALLQKAIEGVDADDGTLFQLAEIQYNLGELDGCVATLRRTSPHLRSSLLGSLLGRERENRELIKEVLPGLIAEATSLDLLKQLRYAAQNADLDDLRKEKMATLFDDGLADGLPIEHQMSLLNEIGRTEEATALAHQILNDPALLPPNESRLTDALNLLRESKQLELYLTQLKAQDPPTLRQQLLLAFGTSLINRDDAIPYYEKALALDPPDPAPIRLRLLGLAQESPAALPIARELLESSPELFAQNSHLFIEVFNKANQLPELAEIVLAIPDHVFESANISWAFQQLSQSYAEFPDITVALLQRAIGIAEKKGGNADSQRQQLIPLLVQQKQSAEARKQIARYFFPPEAARHPILNVNRRRGNHLQPSWLGNISLAPEPAPPEPPIALLKEAIALGMADDLAAESRKAENEYVSLLLRILQRDTSVLPEIASLSKALAGRDHYYGNFVMLAARELADWPEGHGEALRLFQQITATPSFNTGQQLYATTQSIRLATLLRDVPKAREGWRKWVSLVINDRQSQLYDILPLATEMIRDPELLPEARQLHQWASGSRETERYKDRWLAFEAAMALAAGDIQQIQGIAVVTPNSTPEEACVIWEILPNAATEDRNTPFITGRANPQLEKRFTLELLHRTPPNTIRRLAVIPNAASKGEWKGQLPTADGAVMAQLIHDDLMLQGLWAPYSLGKNLLPPLLPEGTWRTSAGVRLSPGTNQPAANLHPVTISGIGDQSHWIASPSYPVPRNRHLTLSGWTHFDSRGNAPRLVIRFFSEKGEQLQEQTLYPRGRQLPGQWCYVTRSFSIKGDTTDQIPEKAVTFEVGIQFWNSEGTVAGIHLTETPLEESKP